MDGLAVLQAELVCNLGVILDLQLLLQEHSSWGNKGLCTVTMNMVIHALGHLPNGLLQCAIHGAVLEKYAEASAGTKCSGVGSYMHSSFSTLTFVPQAAVVAS